MSRTGGDDADQMRELAGQAIAAGAPLSWYEQLYANAAAGTGSVPWDHRQPAPILLTWLDESLARTRTGKDARAIVVGCGYGDDAELVASYGLSTTAFDISDTAVRTARARHPATTVDYQQADLLTLPDRWLRSFDLVVESTTLQCLPPSYHRRAATEVGRLCAAGGTVLVIARQPQPADPPGPPWLLSEPDVRHVGTDGLELIGLDTVAMNGGPRWVAEFSRPAERTTWPSDRH